MVEKTEKRRKILVTGSSGMLGIDLCQMLSVDYDVVGLDIVQPSAISARGARLPDGQGSALGGSRQLSAFISCDIADKDKIIQYTADANPDFIIHAAAWTDVDGCEREPYKAQKANVIGTENVARSAFQLDVPLMLISTDFVFDGKKNLPYTEDDEPKPINVYGKSKYSAEERVSKLNEFIILRTGWLYGANGKNFVNTILRKSKEEKKLAVVDDQVGAPTYTKDLAKAINRLLYIICQQSTVDSRQNWGIYHVSNKGAVSWFDYAKEILKIAKIGDVELDAIKSDELDRSAKRPSYSVLDNTKFEKTTDFTMRSWKDALKGYLQEYKYEKSGKKDKG